MHDVRRTRQSGGFSLEEAARLYRSSAAGIRLECPTCGGHMRDAGAEPLRGGIALLRCETCGRGLVFDRPAPRARE